MQIVSGGSRQGACLVGTRCVPACRAYRANGGENGGITSCSGAESAEKQGKRGEPTSGVMKSWSCIEFVFIQLSLTGLPQPRTGRQFIAWGVSPRNPEPSNDDPEPPKGAAEGEAWRCLIATRRSSGSRSSVAPVGGSGQQSWWLPLDFTSPGADAARL